MNAQVTSKMPKRPRPAEAAPSAPSYKPHRNGQPFHLRKRDQTVHETAGHSEGATRRTHISPDPWPLHAHHIENGTPTWEAELITVTVRGRMVEDWDLRFAASGKAWAKARVVSARNTKNDTGQWEEKDTTFVTCKVFGTQAEQIAESLAKGDQVTVIGRLLQENWETEAGEKRSALVVIADEVAATVRHHQVKVLRMERTSGQPATAGRHGSSRREADPWAGGQAADDPWAA